MTDDTKNHPIRAAHAFLAHSATWSSSRRPRSSVGRGRRCHDAVPSVVPRAVIADEV